MRSTELLLVVLLEACDRSAALDQAQVTQLAHRWLDAYGQCDAGKLTTLLADGFVSFEGDFIQERGELLDVLRSRREHGRALGVTTYREQRVWIGEAANIYSGHLIERSASGDTTSVRDGWYTLVFTSTKAGWKASSMQWVANEGAADEQQWDEIYREQRPVNPEPNAWLAEIAATLEPGAALDVGVGAGRNSVYLASKGWRVTGIDVAEVGLQRAREAAAARHVTIETVHADEGRWDWGARRWDLIALIYMGCDDELVSKVRQSLKPGGVIVMERYHVDSSARLGTTPDALARLFDRDFQILRNEVVEDNADWSDHPEQRMKLIRFAARRK